MKDQKARMERTLAWQMGELDSHPGHIPKSAHHCLSDQDQTTSSLWDYFLINWENRTKCPNPPFCVHIQRFQPCLVNGLIGVCRRLASWGKGKSIHPFIFPSNNHFLSIHVQPGSNAGWILQKVELLRLLLNGILGIQRSQSMETYWNIVQTWPFSHWSALIS